MRTMNVLQENAASRQRIADAISHRQPDRVPVDFGATNCSGIHASCVAALRDYYGLEKRLVRISEPGQMLGVIDDDLIAAMGIDTVGVFPRNTRYGFAKDKWKSWRLNGLEALVPEGFTVTTDANGDTLMYPQSDLSAPPSARMPAGGFFFDNIIRQDAIDEEKLNPEDNLEEYRPISQQDLDWLDRETAAAATKGLGVVASFGGTAFGDIANVPGPALRHPRGIRDVTEWYVSTTSRRDYIHQVFDGQCRIALENLARIHAVVGDRVQAVYLCGTDFGTQTSAFCSVKTFQDLYSPYYKRVCDWIHAHTSWKVLKHSCGAVSKFIPAFIEAGIDILNPVQCSAAGMDPAALKANFGDRIVFWGGGVDTQQVLPFGTPAQVREQVLRRCEVFSPGGGFVFNTVHNIQAQTPVANIVAMIDAVREFNGH
jgi:hypothetical protein